MKKLTICPDYDQLLYDENGVSISCDMDGTIDALYDYNGNPIIVPEIRDWYLEIEPIVRSAAFGDPYEKDWKDYHQRGLFLAHQLRLVLSPDFELWYSAPTEDQSNIINEPMLI